MVGTLQQGIPLVIFNSLHGTPAARYTLQLKGGSSKHPNFYIPDKPEVKAKMKPS